MARRIVSAVSPRQGFVEMRVLPRAALRLPWASLWLPLRGGVRRTPHIVHWQELAAGRLP